MLLCKQKDAGNAASGLGYVSVNRFRLVVFAPLWCDDEYSLNKTHYIIRKFWGISPKGWSMDGRSAQQTGPVDCRVAFNMLSTILKSIFAALE